MTLFLTANGSGDSHAPVLANGRRNGNPRAGTPYRGISWDRIRELIDAPTARPKNTAAFVILSGYREADGRTHEVQRERGTFGGLAVDIDTGSPTLTEVVQAVAAVTGGARVLIYSSSSATPEKRKWRVLIPLAAPLAGADYRDTQIALFGLLWDQGLVCDVALARTAQPVYLPNVPPEKRGADGTPIFYQSADTGGPLLHLGAGTAIVEARDDLRRMEAARIAASEARRAEWKARAAARGDDFDHAEEFNRTHAVADLLALYKFKKHPRRDDWQSPLSSSGSYSTQDRGDHWVCVSAWAHTHKVGWPTKNGNRCGDAFSLFVHFEHGGDRRAARWAYLDQIGRLPDDLAAEEPVIVEKMPDRGAARDIDDWRAEMLVERSLALRVPGLHLDRSQTGSGKTYATIAAIRQAVKTTAAEAAEDETVKPLRRTLTALPTHENVRERVAEMQAAGIDAVAYPARDESNCGAMEAVRRAESLGLSAGAAVCAAPCPLRDRCTYLVLQAEADAADHAVCTHERLRLAPGATTRDRDAVVIDETPEAVLAPRVSVRVDDFNEVVNLARTVRDGYLYRHGGVMEADAEGRGFADLLVQTHALIIDAVRDATGPGVVEVVLPAAAESPKSWAPRLLRWAVENGLTPGPDRHKAERFRKALRLLTMAATGKLDRLHLQVDQTTRHEKQPDGTVQSEERLHHFAVGVFRPRLPEVPILLLDATADIAGIRRAAGREVKDITPAGHLPAVVPVTQVPLDVTAGQSPSTAAGLIEAWMDAHPDLPRVGLIGHQDHVRAIMADDRILPPRLRARVVKSCYFGQGPDRASNDWHETCDAILVVGTLRPGGGAVREALIVRGQIDAARETGDWGTRHWEATTTDGRTVTMEGRGYRHADWHAAHAAISRAAVLQAIGRGRSITGAGRPVWVFSDEPMGCPIDNTLQPVSPAVREAVEAVRSVRDGEPGRLLFPIESAYRKKSPSGTLVRVSAVIAEMQATAGGTLGVAGAKKRLRLARDHGRLQSPERGWLAVVGDETPAAPAGAAEAPAGTVPEVQAVRPRPALVTPPVQAVVISATGPAAAAPPIIARAAPVPETAIAAPGQRPRLHDATAGAAGLHDAISTTTVPRSADDLAAALVEAAEERAAIMEADGGLPPDLADRLAREAIFGRDAVQRTDAPDPVVAAVDVVSLAAREHPFPREVLTRITGTIAVIDDRRDPFAGRRRPAARQRPGVCTCGSEEWVEVPIHPTPDGGHQSARTECQRCLKFGWYSRWYGQPQPDPRHPPPRPSALPHDLPDRAVVVPATVG